MSVLAALAVFAIGVTIGRLSGRAVNWWSESFPKRKDDEL